MLWLRDLVPEMGGIGTSALPAIDGDLAPFDRGKQPMGVDGRAIWSNLYGPISNLNQDYLGDKARLARSGEDTVVVGSRVPTNRPFQVRPVLFRG